MPSRVSAHRLSDASDTSAPQGAWSKPPSTYGDEGVLAGVPPGSVPAVVAEGDRLGQGDVEPAGPGDARATWATSSAWVSRVRWWSSGKTNTWVLPARRRNDGACRIRSRSRSKQVRHGSGSSARARSPAPAAVGGARSELAVLGSSRADRSKPGDGPHGPRSSAAAVGVGEGAPRPSRGRPWWPPTAGSARSRRPGPEPGAGAVRPGSHRRPCGASVPHAV